MIFCKTSRGSIQIPIHPDRIFPGRYVADNSVFIAVVRVWYYTCAGQWREWNTCQGRVHVGIHAVSCDTLSSALMTSMTIRPFYLGIPEAFQCKFKTCSEAGESHLRLCRTRPLTFDQYCSQSAVDACIFIVSRIMYFFTPRYPDY